MTECTPDSVHSTLSKHILADGYEFVVDLDRSKGSRLYDSRADRDILDMFSCFASLPIGWNHPKLVAMESRLGRIAVNNITNSDLYSTEMAEAIDTIGRLAKPDHMSHMFFIAGGALGVENSLKAAMDWKQQDRNRKGLAGDDSSPMVSIAHLDEAFHGRTGYTMSLTNTDPTKTDRYAKFNWPRIPNPKIHFPLDESESARLDRAEAEAIDSLHLAAEANPDQIAGVIIEPIQGEGGDNHFRPQFLQALEKATHDIGALFIVDEVQTGVGGTGKMWAYEHYGIKPDLLAFGKKMQICGIMGGAPITDNEDNVFETSSRINSTWGGNLVDMVRGAACLEVIEEEDLLSNATKVGSDLLKGLKELGQRHDIISNVRGKGLFAAFTLPNKAMRDTFRMQALDDGLLALNSGFDSIRLRPCLNLSADEADEALAIFENTTKSIESLQVA
uniref:L-lysine-epsilon aminotransferase n=1 Tax=uncultured marine group II/III euryarchaeote KM3_102_D05 TaxID=1457845 RepID=A0A075GBC2_9EURY|nr:L-lysine 6-transaminase (lat) [uncultured marine group II/III euryarchaeote KM3_102_D05]